MLVGGGTETSLTFIFLIRNTKRPAANTRSGLQGVWEVMENLFSVGHDQSARPSLAEAAGVLGLGVWVL